MHHYQNIGELISEIEVERRRHEHVADQKMREATEMRSKKKKGFVEVEAQARSARVRASALGYVGMWLDDTYIGPDPKTAKALRECG